MTLENLIIFASLGYIFPVQTNSKIPINKWPWRARNTQDPKVLASWLQTYSTNNWALIPGPGILVVDVDCKEGKPSGFKAMQELGVVPSTFSVRTPSGGIHLYYRTQHSEIYANHFLEGVDLRGSGGKGYVLLPYSQINGVPYEPIGDPLIDLAAAPDSLEQRIIERLGGGDGRNSRASSVQIPTPPLHSTYTATFPPRNSGIPTRRKGVAGVRPQVNYCFFRNPENVSLWRVAATPRMKDRSLSGFEYQLAVKLAGVGANPDEVLHFYSCWCQLNRILPRVDRFKRKIMPAAYRKAAAYIDAWRAAHPERRKQGTTNNVVIDAIRSGMRTPAQIRQVTRLPKGTVKMALRRMVTKGAVIGRGGGYSLPESSVAAFPAVRDGADLRVASRGLDVSGPAQHNSGTEATPPYSDEAGQETVAVLASITEAVA